MSSDRKINHDCNSSESEYLTENTENYEWLMESKAQLESGKFSAHDLVDESTELNK